MSKNHEYFMDKQTMLEIGLSLWKLRCEKRFYLDKVEKETGIPKRIIEGLEIGKFLQYGTMRKLLQYYGKKIKITFE